MTKTVVAFGDPKAQKKWSGALFIDITKKSYWDRKFIGTSDEYAIPRLTDLESELGDTITFDLSVQLRNRPTYGDQRLEGKEESLRLFSDQIKIDQMRHGVSAGGKMSRKRTAHNMRQVGKNRLSDYWSKFNDQMIFIYMSGARGINEDFIETVEWAGHAENPIEAPDADHILYGGDATAKANLDSADIMSRAVIERAQTKARMMSAKDPKNANMMPIMINGEAHYVCVMNPFQEFDLRNKDQAGWLDIQKAAATAEGRASPIFKGGLGMINNTVLHSHEWAIRFKDYGAAGNVAAGRALFIGRQGGVIAFGSAGGFRYTWTEETKDHGNEPVVGSGVTTLPNGMMAAFVGRSVYFCEPWRPHAWRSKINSRRTWWTSSGPSWAALFSTACPVTISVSTCRLVSVCRTCGSGRRRASSSTVTARWHAPPGYHVAFWRAADVA